VSVTAELRGFEETEQRKEPALTRFDRFVSFAYRVFRRPASSLVVRMPKMREGIQRSNMHMTPEGLLSVALFMTALVAVVSAAMVLVGFVYFGIVWFLFAPLAIPVVYLLIVSLPGFSATTRSAAIENEMPFVLGYMSVLAGGGVAPMAAIRRISEMKLLPASSKEAKRIMLQTDVFGQDPITAMEEVARTTPSRHFSEFLAGTTAILKTGGDLEAYVSTKLRDVVAVKGSSIRRSSEITGTLAEAYLTVTVVLGMTLYTLNMISVLLSHSYSALLEIYLFAFLIVPLISAAFIWLMDATQPKWPFTDYRPYRSLVYSIPIGLVIFFVPLPIPFYQHTALALIALAAPGAVFATKYSREKRAIERALPDFIRDVAEGRKTGLSPERSIERLNDRPYGRLSKPVQKMGSQLSWGVSLANVINGFTASVNSWITKIIGTLLVEVVDVGGGTVRSFVEMADFTRTVNDLENDRRASLRSFVMITYIAGILVIITTFIMVYMLTEPLQIGVNTTQLDPTTIDMLLTTAVFQTFVIGLVAGKMGESNVSDGFKHAIFLVIASVLSVFIAKLFIHIPV
jgi:flagellar protein FlaJ